MPRRRPRRPVCCAKWAKRRLGDHGTPPGAATGHPSCSQFHALRGVFVVPVRHYGRMWGRRERRRRRRDGCDCDVCDLPFCDLGLLSSLLLLVSRAPSARKRSDRVVLSAIRAYRRVSPRLPTRCRYTPTCSAYGLEAVQRYGTRTGLRLTVGRLLRCRPGVPYGTLDPVP